MAGAHDQVRWATLPWFTTLALLLYSLTGFGIGVSGAVVAEILPVLLLAPLAGSLVDRLPRVQVMVGADLGRVVLAGVPAVWHDDVAVAYAVAFGLVADVLGIRVVYLLGALLLVVAATAGGWVCVRSGRSTG